MAVDENQPMLRSEVPVTVAINDVNDQSPLFEFPADDNRTFPVSSGVPPGFPVVTVDARDDDAGENARLSYEIVNTDVPPAELQKSPPLFRINRCVALCRQCSRKRVQQFKKKCKKSCFWILSRLHVMR